MAKFVEFDDGFGTYNYRAIFPSNTSIKIIKESLQRSLFVKLRKRGLGKEDMPSNNEIRDWLSITGMRDGVFYEPEWFKGRQW